MLSDNDMIQEVKVKMYDFQLYSYQSLAFDLILFLFTSVRSNDLAENFKMFINYYHEEFVNELKLLNCPLNDYSFDK